MNVLATPFRYYSPTYFDRIASPAYGGRTGRNLEVRKTMMLDRKKYPPSNYGYSMQLLGGATWSSCHFLEMIPHETLVIVGDDDPLIPIFNARTLADRIPNATLELVSGAGHLFLWDEAERIGRRIFRFLEGGEAAGPEAANGHQDASAVTLKHRLSAARETDLPPVLKGDQAAGR